VGEGVDAGCAEKGKIMMEIEMEIRLGDMEKGARC
jgi:hypothetical protein